MRAEGFCVASCEHCGQHIEFPSSGAGMRVACPHCGGETGLVAEAVPLPAEDERVTAAELKAGLEGVVPRCRISLFYQLGLLLVAGIMVLLPIAYLAFAALAGYLVYWYALHARRMLYDSPVSVHGLILRLVFYLGPIIGGMVAVFFMFKPLLARRRKPAEPLELNPAELPRVYQLIAHVSDLLRVRVPRRIWLDCELNASAGFRRGLMSFLGRDLVVTIGLPLVAGLNTRQLAAVVAHELGHCTQGLAMRLGYLIDRIDGWFARVVFERDTWDEALDEWDSSVDDWRLSLIVGCARFGVGFSRKVLTLLMLIGHAASCFLSRQMEYHADACASEVAGSQGLESLLVRVQELNVLAEMVHPTLRQLWQKRRQLPDSVPEFYEQMEQRLPPQFHEEPHQTLLNETGGLLATHPTPAQRIQKARQRGAAGIFALEKPARGLFENFAGTARLVTARHYRQGWRLGVTDAMLKPASEFFEEAPRKKLVVRVVGPAKS